MNLQRFCGRDNVETLKSKVNLKILGMDFSKNLWDSGKFQNMGIAVACMDSQTFCGIETQSSRQPW